MQKQIGSTQTLPSILICGYERGGTTLLADVLRSNGYESGFECGVLMCSSPKEFLNYKPYVDMISDGWGIQPELVQEICSGSFEQFYEQLIANSNQTIKSAERYFDKTPIYMSKLGRVLHRTSFINKAFVIHRDPRSVFTSWARREHSEEGVEKTVLELLDNYSVRYVNYFTGCIAHLKNPNVLFLSYEDLCLHEEDSCRKVGMFVDGKAFVPRSGPSRFINVEGTGMDLSKVFAYKNYLSDQTQTEILQRTQIASVFFATEEDRVKYKEPWEETVYKIDRLREFFGFPDLCIEIGGKYFEPTTYLVRHQDILSANINPCEHFLFHGIFEGRSPH